MCPLSVQRPQNEAILNLKDHETHWKLFFEATQKIPKNIEIPMIIDGQKVYSLEKLKNKNPSNGESLGVFQQADSSHATRAVEAALKAKAAWASLAPTSRIQKFRDLEEILLKWRYELCAVASVECGYNALETSVEWSELIDFLRFNNYFYTKLLKTELGDGWGETNQLHMRPLAGFTCAITPFNFPQAIGYHLPLAMALTGNTVVWKPSDDAVMSAYMLMLAIEEAGFLPGVINLLTGDGKQCLPHVLTHRDLCAVNFTGSFETARSLGNYLYNTQYPRHNFPRFIAETGGKDFLVADKDIDVRETARAIAQGAFGRSGQKCSANSVAFIDERIWPALRPTLLEEIQSLVLCSSIEKNCDVGPVINERQFDKIVKYIKNAKKDKNCKILIGGSFQKQKGYYITPTVIEVFVDHHELLKEEIFGPVLAVKIYKKFEELVPLITQHHYRLTGSVISRDENFLETAVPLLSQFAGNFYVNRKTTGAVVDMQPFGGDCASGTNAKAGGQWYLLNFISQGIVTRRHTRSTTQNALDKMASS
jgi:1-pyrroline-5-carboxylate dehydrogenase